LPEKVPEPFDIAIRRGVEGWPSAVKAQAFLEDELVVVAAPSLLKAQADRRGRSRWRSTRLLVVKTRKQDWDDWKMNVGLPASQAGESACSSITRTIVLQAAVDGLGFAITARSLLGTDVTQGRLGLPVARSAHALAGGCITAAPPGIGPRDSSLRRSGSTSRRALG